MKIVREVYKVRPVSILTEVDQRAMSGAYEEYAYLVNNLWPKDDRPA
jgi:hypothetical protein